MTVEAASEVRLTRLVKVLTVVFHVALWGARAALERTRLALPLERAFATTDPTWPKLTPPHVVYGAHHPAAYACQRWFAALAASLAQHLQQPRGLRRARRRDPRRH